MRWKKKRKTNAHEKNFGAKQIEVNGHKFDSKMEADEYNRLWLLEKGGVISNLTLQPKFEILPAFNVATNTTKNGKSRQSAMTYTPDFLYVQGLQTVVVEVKGFATTSYKMRKKMFMYKMREYGVDMFIEVTSKDRKTYELITKE